MSTDEAPRGREDDQPQDPAAQPEAKEGRASEAAALPGGGPLTATIHHQSLSVFLRVSTDAPPGTTAEDAAAGAPPRTKQAPEPKAASSPAGKEAEKKEPGREGTDDGKQGKEGSGDKKPSGAPWYQRPGLVGILIAIFIAAVVVGVLLWLHARRYEATDDAYIDAISERVSPQVSGRIRRVLVDDDQDVAAGQVLVELDPADYQSRVDQSRAAQAQAEAQLAQARAQQVVLGAQLEQARANAGTAQVNADNAARDLARYRGLQADSAGAVSGQQLDRAQAASLSAAANLTAAQAAVAAARAQLGYVRSQIAAAQAAIGSAAAQAHEAELTLGYTQVKAEVAGRIASKTVTVGDFVAAGAALMAVVPRDVYVTANFKETQLDHLRDGQPVKIKIDAYPEVKIGGRLSGVQPGSGQAFSLLPAENATGNWVKVVQRLPVKILLDELPRDPGIRLAPGMSVEVTVTVR